MKSVGLVCVILVVLLSGCGVSYGDAIAPDEIILYDIPSEVTGIDSDLWVRFVELTNDLNCELPCWWGLQLGETTLDEVLVFLEETEFNRSKERTILTIDPITHLRQDGFWLNFTEYYDSTNFGDMTFFFDFDETDLLEGIYINMANTYRWLPDTYNPLALHNIITTMPSEPIIQVSPNTTVADIYLYVTYSEHNLRFSYRFDFENYPEICVDEDLLSIHMDIVLEPIASDYFDLMAESYWFEGITGTEFMQFLRDNSGACLDVSG